MASSAVRRPLPALVSLLALLVLSGIVWWRVLHRGGSEQATVPACPTSAAAAAPLPAPGAVTLAVLNNTRSPGLASRTRTTLLADGFRIPAKAGDDTPKGTIHASAEIRFGPAGTQAAALVHYYFPDARLRRTARRDGTVVVSLGARYRGVASTAAAQHALHDDDRTLASSSAQSGASATC